MHFFTVTFDNFNASFLNKIISFKQTNKQMNEQQKNILTLNFLTEGIVKIKYIRHLKGATVQHIQTLAPVLLIFLSQTFTAAPGLQRYFFFFNVN